MKTKKKLPLKRIVSLILVASVACASICLLTGCVKHIDDNYSNDGEFLYYRSYKLDKGQEYEISIDDNVTCPHTLQVMVDIKDQQITIESGYLIESNNMSKMKWVNKETVTLKKGKYHTYTKDNLSIYKIKITPNNNCTFTYYLSRHVDTKDNIDLTSSKSSSYGWTATSTPGGMTYVTKARLYLTKSDAKKVGKIFANESVLNCIKTISSSASSDYNQSKSDYIYSQIEKAVNAAVNSKSTSGSKMVVSALSGVLTGLASMAIDYLKLSIEIEKVANTLLTATEPMCVTFEQGSSGYFNPYSAVGTFSLSSMQDSGTKKYGLIGPIGHEGEFVKVKFN